MRRNRLIDDASMRCMDYLLIKYRATPEEALAWLSRCTDVRSTWQAVADFQEGHLNRDLIYSGEDQDNATMPRNRTRMPVGSAKRNKRTKRGTPVSGPLSALHEDGNVPGILDWLLTLPPACLWFVSFTFGACLVTSAWAAYEWGMVCAGR